MTSWIFCDITHRRLGSY